jgi:hypothetical protein
MRWSILTAALLLMVFSQPGHTQTTAPAGQVTLEGQFDWNGKNRSPLSAVLTPSGEGKWTAVFSFNWRGRGHRWQGTFSGDPKNGEVSGTSGSGNRSWVFRGRSEKGVITCRHFETTRGNEQPTGSFTLNCP